MVQSRRILFIDDYNITEINGLKRTMNSALKYPGNPVIRPDRPWEEGNVYGKNSVIYDYKAKCYKMWYNLHNACYAESDDGLSWRKPNLGFVKYGDSYSNNLLGSDMFQITYGDDDFGKMKPGWEYTSMNWSHEKGNYLVTSSDGLRWNNGPLVEIPGAGDTFVTVKSTRQLTGNDGNLLPGYPKLKGMPRYIGAARWCKPVGRFDGSDELRPVRRVQALLESDDMIHWKNPTRILSPDAFDDEIANERIEEALSDGTLVHDCKEDRRCEFYTMFIIPYEEMYIGLLLVFYPSYNFCRMGTNNQAGPGDIQLVASRDLVHWSRLGERKPFIPKGSPGEFDQALAWYISMPVLVDGMLRFYYSGITATHAGSRDEAYMNAIKGKVASGELPGITSMGIASLRRDGFVSLDAGNKTGYVLTNPFPWPEGKKLHINADASNGEVSVCVCQPDGIPFIGYEESEVMRGDMLDETVSFNGAVETVKDRLHTHGTNMEAPAETAGDADILNSGRMARLKIFATNAKLYSYWFV